MTTPPLTNEQKLDVIYTLLQKQQSRESRSFWYSLLKRVIIYGAMLLVVLNPGAIFGYITDLIMPRVMDAMTQALNQQKTDAVDGINDTKAVLMQKIRDMVPTQQPEPSQY